MLKTIYWHKCSKSQKLPCCWVYIDLLRSLGLEGSFVYVLGCFTKTLFQKKNKRNPPCISLGVSLKGSKRIFDFDNV